MAKNIPSIDYLSRAYESQPLVLSRKTVQRGCKKDEQPPCRADMPHQRVLLSNMMHNLRNPLSGIFAMAETIVDASNEPDTVRMANRLITESNKMLTMVNNYLCNDSIEEGVLTVKKRPVDLRKTMADAAEAAKLWVHGKPITVSLHLDPKLPPMIETDPVLLDQIIGNLISNSVKYTLEGSIELACFRVEKPDSDGDVLISITDTGFGISEQQLEGIFLRYRMLGNTQFPAYNSNGLGLHICKELIGLLGGTIAVTSEHGRGSCFYFQLPSDSSSQVL